MKKITYIFFIFVFVSGRIFAQDLDTANFTQVSRTSIVLYETGMGILLTAGTFLPAAIIIGSVSDPDGLGETLSLAFLTSSLAMTLGGSYGVHLIDKKYNRNSSYFLALAGSFVGYSLTYLLLTKNDGPITGIEALTAGIAPLAFSILTVNLIDFERFENKIAINYQPLANNNGFQHKLSITVNL